MVWNLQKSSMNVIAQCSSAAVDTIIFNHTFGRIYEAAFI